MRIVIDGQRMQRALRFADEAALAPYRALIDALADPGIHFFLALSSQFPESIAPIATLFERLIPRTHRRVMQLPSWMGDEEAEQLRTAFLLNLAPHIILAPEFGFPLEGYAPFTQASIGAAIPLFCVDEEVLFSYSVNHFMGTEQVSGEAMRHCFVFAPYAASKEKPQINVSGLALIQLIFDPQQQIFTQESIAAAIDTVRQLAKQAKNAPADIALALPRQQIKPKLAYVSPLPPLKTGIADYSAELIPQLACFYDIEVIIDQDHVSDPWIQPHCTLRNIAWFREHGHAYDRVLYHIGNSPYHQRMFALLAAIPGVVVLHDFYLGNVQHHREVHRDPPDAFIRALVESHGYRALLGMDLQRDREALIKQYPCNAEVLQHATAIITHSRHARDLASHWYPDAQLPPWSIIPLLRSPAAPEKERGAARAALGLHADDFLVCCFGFLVPTKMNALLIQAWKASMLAKDTRCLLVFVGENHDGSYGHQIATAILDKGLAGRVRITGWADQETFRRYLNAADLAVQLRTDSRGETSAAVLDCLNYGIPLIVNAVGSMDELPEETVWRLSAQPTDLELTRALEILRQDARQRKALGERGRAFLLQHHQPAACAQRYVEVLEQVSLRKEANPFHLIRSLATKLPPESSTLLIKDTVCAVSASLQPFFSRRQLLLDVSATLQEDLKTGIERTVKSISQSLMALAPGAWSVQPVYLSDCGGRWHYRYARSWSMSALCAQGSGLDFCDQPVETVAGDCLLILDYSGALAVTAAQAGVHAQLKLQGVSILAIVYDLLPITMPEMFPPYQFTYLTWLHALSCFVNAFIGISRAVRDDLFQWLQVSSAVRGQSPSLHWFHLGADVRNTPSSTGMPKNAPELLAACRRAPTFLMVGTIEPRKGYLQALEAFSLLWSQGLQVRLIIVGREGWTKVPAAQRRSIPHLMARLRSHPERGHRLIWLEGISDEYLEAVYQASTCLLAASEGEGFGLPLIEAAQHRLPIIARDIPVFREVAGSHAYYFFNETDPAIMAESIRQWLELFAQGKHPRSEGMPWLSWRESAQQLLNVIKAENDPPEAAKQLHSAAS